MQGVIHERLEHRRGQPLKIELCRADNDTGEEVQKIPVEIDDPQAACLTYGVHREDINFDGYQDLAVFQHGGAKWGLGHWWIYDPDTGTFQATELSEELREIGFASYTVDAEKKVIRFRIFHGAALNEEVYAVEKGHLKLIEKRNNVSP